MDKKMENDITYIRGYRDNHPYDSPGLKGFKLCSSSKFCSAAALLSQISRRPIKTVAHPK